MDATIQIANVKTVTVVATALAEPKFNPLERGCYNSLFFFVKIVFVHDFMLMYFEKDFKVLYLVFLK